MRQSRPHPSLASPVGFDTRRRGTDPRSHSHAQSKAHAVLPDTPPPRASRAASELFFDQILHGPVFQRQVGVHALEPGIFGFQLLHALQFRHPHATVLGFSVVLGRITDPMLAADILYLNPGIGLTQDRDNLAFRKSRLFHLNLLT